MQISFSEKLILIMLADIHKRLSVQSEVDAQLVKDAILDGQSWALYWEYGELLDVNIPDRVWRKTAEILDMWIHLEAAFNDLSQSDRVTFADQCACSLPLKFRGFDENEEIEYLGVAEFMIEKMDRVFPLKGRRLGLQTPTLARYDAMLSIFNSFRHKIYTGSLNIDELISICRIECFDVASDRSLGPQ